ncbi:MULTISPECIES: thiamine pyrophosphate-dependent enzyme [unclassified Rhodococcus (in: high G+C Gram-positive bacteria)]|jgi:phosphonopyruvate decarboxylase|uniref:thiamine pyrophosphate-dependent enzyme n=1 Tax=unclassified Rhodococcus (in: high G+C Gram-positive bacteria) TaxID=192944 RepID=UPI00031AF4B5|nr:thiamine pyrophosphate-dependent enzyme [Rhodococcus sp. DK17]
MSADTTSRIDRRLFVADLLSEVPDALMVTGLGSPSYDVCAAGARPRNFYLWGAMGAATPLGLGLALAQPDESVVVITGDGEQLMGIGALGTIAVQAPPNLTIVVLDNGHFGETGMQPSHSSLGTDLCSVAQGFGIETTLRIDSHDGYAQIGDHVRARRGTTFAQVLISSAEAPRVLPPRDGIHVKNIFRAEFGFSPF